MSIRKGEMQFKLAIVVRDDLKMSPGKLAAQVAHAAVTCALEAKARKPKWFAEWYSEGQRKVVLRVRDLEELKVLANKAKHAGLTNTIIADAGLTELPPNTATCLGVGPAPEGDVDKITGSLPLA